jgi:hypothetical protein
VTKEVEDQIRRMIRSGQVLPSRFCAFTPEEIIERFQRAKRIEEAREASKYKAEFPDAIKKEMAGS